MSTIQPSNLFIPAPRSSLYPDLSDLIKQSSSPTSARLDLSGFGAPPPYSSLDPLASVDESTYEIIEDKLHIALHQFNTTFKDFNTLALDTNSISHIVTVLVKSFNEDTALIPDYKTVLAQANAVIKQLQNHKTLKPDEKTQLEKALRASLYTIPLIKGISAINHSSCSKEEIIDIANTIHRDIFNFATCDGEFQDAATDSLDLLLDAVIQKCDLKKQFDTTGSIGINRLGFSRLTQGLSSKTKFSRLIEKLTPIAGKSNIPMSILQNIAGLRRGTADENFNRLRKALGSTEEKPVTWKDSQLKALVDRKQETLKQLEALLPKASVEPSAIPLRRPGIAVSSPSWINFLMKPESTEDAEKTYNGLSSLIQRDLIRHVYLSGTQGFLETRVSELFKTRVEGGNPNGLYYQELRKLDRLIGPASNAGEDLLDRCYKGHAVNPEHSAQYLADLKALVPKITSEDFGPDLLYGHIADLASPINTPEHADMDAQLFTRTWAQENFSNPNYRNFVIQAIERFLHERAE